MVAIGEHRDLLDSLDVWRPWRRREREIAEVGHVHRPAAAADDQLRLAAVQPQRGGADGLAGPDVEQGPIDERPGAHRRVHARAEKQALVGRAGQCGDPVGMADLEYHLGPGRLDAEVELVFPEAELRGHSAPGLEALQSQPGVLLELLEALGQAVPMRVVAQSPAEGRGERVCGSDRLAEAHRPVRGEPGRHAGPPGQALQPFGRHRHRSHRGLPRGARGRRGRLDAGRQPADHANPPQGAAVHDLVKRPAGSTHVGLSRVDRQQVMIDPGLGLRTRSRSNGRGLAGEIEHDEVARLGPGAEPLVHGPFQIVPRRQDTGGVCLWLARVRVAEVPEQKLFAILPPRRAEPLDDILGVVRGRRAVGDRGVIVVLDANDDGPKLRGPLRWSRRIGSRGPPHHRPHHDRQEPAAAQPTCLHQFLRGGNPSLEADHTWCPGGAASWHAAKLRLTHVFFPLGIIGNAESGINELNSPFRIRSGP